MPKGKEEIQSLNDSFDDLSIEELEKRLEMDPIPLATGLWCDCNSLKCCEGGGSYSA